jgi:GDP-4-dehydro-6-deoxy-D-mannose reductase
VNTNRAPSTEHRAPAGPVLITGASGFVGRYLVEALNGAHDVVGWARREMPAQLAGRVRWMQIDLRHRDVVHRALRDLRPARLFHCAGAARVDRSWVSPVEPLESNVLATHYLLDGVRRAGGGCRVLVTGSAAVYAPSRTPIAEEGRVGPDSPYATSKLGQEMLALRSVVEDGLEVIVTRPFNHTGPRQEPAYVAPGIARQIARIERGLQPPILQVGHLDTRRDLTDVRDVVRAYVALMERGTSGEIYNVASGTAHRIGDLADRLVASAGVPIRVEIDAVRVRAVDNPTLVGDASKLRRTTGWQPEIPFERMLSDLLGYWRGVPDALLRDT